MSIPSQVENWTVGRVLQWTQARFAERGIDSARLDAELLLADALGVDRVYLYTHYDQPLTSAERDRYRERVLRRSQREPVAYILGRREFFGRPFCVSSAVLVPRPETEHVVEAALAWVAERGEQAPTVLDVGTGCGAIGITLACEIPHARVLATDVSPQALRVAEMNAEALGVRDRVDLRCGDLLEPARCADTLRPFDLLVSNPPYIDPSTRPSLPPEVLNHEPPIALFADEAGFAALRAIVFGASELLKRPGFLACEMGADQREAALAAAQAALPDAHLATVADLAGHARVITAALP